MKQLLLAILLLMLTGCGTVSEIPTEPAPEAAEPTVGEAAQSAYEALLSGDASMLDTDSAALHGVENWAEFIQIEDFTYEYTYLDLDSDGVDELLIQLEDDPMGYNGVFHYADGKLCCWCNDNIEMSCWDYPLKDGTMVRQYNQGGSCSYILFRYREDGEFEEQYSLFHLWEKIYDDDDRPCPLYTVQYKEVSEAEFEEQLETMITSQLLDRSAWTAI